MRLERLRLARREERTWWRRDLAGSANDSAVNEVGRRARTAMLRGEAQMIPGGRRAVAR